MPKPDKQRGEVLVAIMNKPLDFTVARDEHWYRIPQSSVHKWLSGRWPPSWLAFYQTKVFADEAYSVSHYAQVTDIRKVPRQQLFPDQPRDWKSDHLYYQLMLEPLQQLPVPIISRRWRRIIFIPTTWEKFTTAAEINDLYDDSPLEDRLWAEFKRLRISAERQEMVEFRKNYYFLDFALYCASGKLDVETDGDTWHANPEKAKKDNVRDNNIHSLGWKLLRFTSQQIQEEMDEYCIPKISETINMLGGIEEGNIIPRRIDPKRPGGIPTLFDDIEQAS